jgi:hypothetical protein
VEALDHPGARRVILGDEVGEVLGVELLAESCRFDEIAEDDGQMPALGARQRLVFFGDDLRCYGSPPTGSERSGACTGSFRSLSHVFRFTKQGADPLTSASPQVSAHAASLRGSVRAVAPDSLGGRVQQRHRDGPLGFERIGCILVDGAAETLRSSNSHFTPRG